MDFLRELVLTESKLAAMKEVAHVNSLINKLYTEWKKIKRRTNAVDMVTKSSNKLTQVNPETAKQLLDATKMKLVIILSRCLDLPPWRPVETRKKIYKKLFPLIQSLELVDVNTGTGGTLRDVIMTRLSAAISVQNKEKAKVFVAYEPKIPSPYLRYLFGDEPPVATYRMIALSLPEDFDSLIEILNINHEKAVSKFKDKGGVES